MLEEGPQLKRIIFNLWFYSFYLCVGISVFVHMCIWASECICLLRPGSTNPSGAGVKKKTVKIIGNLHNELKISGNSINGGLLVLMSYFKELENELHSVKMTNIKIYILLVEMNKKAKAKHICQIISWVQFRHCVLELWLIAHLEKQIEEVFAESSQYVKKQGIIVFADFRTKKSVAW